MDYKEAAQALKNYLPDYVGMITHKSRATGNKNFDCPICKSGQGSHKTGAFSIYKGQSGLSWKCHSCGRGGDTVDLIGEMESNLTSRKECIEYGALLFNIDLDTHKYQGAQNVPNKPTPPPTEEKPTEEAPEPEAVKDYMDYYRECEKRRADNHYLEDRGISQDLQSRFMIGFDPEWVSPSAKAKGYNPPTSPRVIIPTHRGSYLARATDPDADPRYSKMHEGKTTPFNYKALERLEAPLYIVEGEIDALSILQVGGVAIGLGSIVMVDKFLTDYIDHNRPSQPVIAALDNDGKENTTKAQEKLVKGLKERGIVCIEYNVSGVFKDANEALVASPEQFKENVTEGIRLAQEAAKEEATAEQTEYLESYCASSILPDFLDRAKAGRNGTLQSTGFKSLDKVLDGGLDNGLCVLGAISSLGKTTFCLQMADQMAAQGRDVLFFSLEMGVDELVSKSLSRLTLINTEDATKGSKRYDTTQASTNRNIARRYNQLPEIQQRAIPKAAETYRQFADHLFFFEGIGDIGVTQIRETLEAHIKITGRTPVIFVDYLQIMAPYNERYSDKQNTDKAVLELKRISRDFNTLVVAISSFNRQSYTDPVNMSSFKESGAIEYSADILLGLQYFGMNYKDDETDGARVKRIRSLMKTQIKAGREGNAQQVEIMVLKNRSGSRGSTNMHFYPMYNAFIDKDLKDFEDCLDSVI